MAMDKNSDDIGRKAGGPDDTAAVRQELLGVKAKLDEVGSALAGTASAAEVTELKASIAAIAETAHNAPGTYDTVIKSLTDRVDELQSSAALTEGHKAGIPSGIKAITRALMDGDCYKSMIASGQVRTVSGTPGENGLWGEKTEMESYAAHGYKAASPVLITDMAGGQLTVTKPGTVEAREFDMSVASRIPSQVVAGATTYSVPKETIISRRGAWVSTLAVTLDGAPTPKTTCTFTDTEGLMVGSIVRFYNATPALLGSAAVVSFNASTNVVTFATNALTWDGTVGWKVTSENYAAIAESGGKPSSFLGTVNETFTMKVLASILPTTVNAINTVAGMAALIERKLPWRSQRNLSRHLIYGDNSAPQLQGLRTYGTAQSSLWSGGVSGDNQLDAVMRAANLIPWGAPLSVVMSQADLPALQLLKGGDGHYLKTGNFGMVPLTQSGLQWFLGPYELVFDYAVASGDFTVINFMSASEIADQNTASLLWGYINTDFENNIIRARYERTLCHAILDVNEYVVGEWDAAP